MPAMPKTISQQRSHPDDVRGELRGEMGGDGQTGITLQDKIDAHTSPGAYHPRTAYNGYSGYHGDD